uniref:G-protein coupled receptors family 1 profile domain-containing protein n=1 Tax=Takifugu rubripes TaxID=31033 RepID=A0A674MJ01_TAKRU
PSHPGVDSLEVTGEPLPCFAKLNSSCKRLNQTFSETAVFSSLLASLSLLTVTLNLLVIISISHFRQLHTPTNTLLLSLAVSDLVVGLLVMPIEGLRYVEMCWWLGSLMCALTPYVSYCVLSASVGNMVLISIDRYLAICDPLLYTTKVTLTRAKIAICLCWACSLLQERYNSCHGECVVVISHISGTVDLFITFVLPCTVMVVMYMRVFIAAVAQMRVIRIQNVALAVNAAPRVTKSEWKAARTLGIVITVFLLCFYTSNNLSYFAVLSWILMINSCVNPLIYALFYPWFRRSIKLIVTFKILRLYSNDIKLL